MKKVFFLAAVLAFSACSDPKKVDSDVIENTRSADNPSDVSENLTTIKFDETHINFGSVIEGEKISHVFSFTNTGNSPLVIKDASASCGCTKPEFPTEPIAPGKKGEIKVTFNSEGKTGTNNKEVTIIANTNPRNTVIDFEVTVNPKD